MEKNFSQMVIITLNSKLSTFNFQLSTENTFNNNNHDNKNPSPLLPDLLHGT